MKTEKWLAEVYPGLRQMFSKYEHLSDREIAIVVAAVFDAALLELIIARLPTDKKEVDDFLGIDGDGRAPCGTFGARIQMAVVLRLFDRTIAKILRTIKEIRNSFAHNVNADMQTPKIASLIATLEHDWRTFLRKDDLARLDRMMAKLTTKHQRGKAVLLFTLATLQQTFFRMHPKVQQIGPATAPTR